MATTNDQAVSGEPPSAAVSSAVNGSSNGTSIKAEVTSPVKKVKSPTKPVLENPRKRKPGQFPDSSDDDDVPLAKRKDVPSGSKKPKPSTPSATKPKVKTERLSSPIKLAKPVKTERSPSPTKPIKAEPVAPRAAKPQKSFLESDSEDDRPLGQVQRTKVAKKPSTPAQKPVKRRKSAAADSDSDDDLPLAKAKRRPSSASSRSATPAKKATASKVKTEKADVKPKPGSRKSVKEEAEKKPKVPRKKKEEEEREVWKWWEEEPLEDGVKWKTLAHKGPVFAPAYEPLPDSVKFMYDGKAYKLSAAAEEVAGFFGRMLEHDYTSKEIFINNFWEDFRKEMTDKERRDITSFKKCDFKHMFEYFKMKTEERKAMSKEEKQKLKEKNEALIKEYGFCLIDGHKEKIGNFRLEPPGLFRGRGDHPKQGKLKRRIQAEDITINIGKDATAPEPPAGHKWKAVQHNNEVTWLVSWSENINGGIKYIMLNATSKLKGEKDWQKYETARRLKNEVSKIRSKYIDDWKSKMMSIRQRAVAVYFIDKLALRAGHEKDPDESADTVGCCSLRVEHIKLHEQHEGKDYVVEFDFLGKDSIRYQNHVPVEKQVFKNLKLFMKDKEQSHELFDRLQTTSLNSHLSELMPGLTAKVFRTYNASFTLQDQLKKLTKATDNTAAKTLSYNRANRAVAILCNHQRSVSKGHDQQMENLQGKIDEKKELIVAAKKEYRAAKRERGDIEKEKAKKKLARLEDQLEKLEVRHTDKDENKSIALGTSKLNYLDPRISVAWCKKFEVPLEKVYNKTQREKFMWAIDMADETFEF
ncbi:DNA topoisomerase I, mitochondrial-like [Sycon ciliatum]|uniref:DNA topoisomerase I, mitochondrial-like n=1 Tax=Sycon ciliatum TaxID=27933 RepID=UPI0020ADFD0D